MKNIFIIAGEPSGDLHGSNLVKSLMARDNTLQIEGLGGDKMEQEGVKILKHYREMAFMGFIEVIMNLRTIKRNLKFVENALQNNPPDLLVLIDFPGFNLRIAKFAKKLGIKVAYYISPQVWAWKQNRVKLIKQVVDRMLVILPFEKEFYQKWNYAVDFVGHPLLDEVGKYTQDDDLKQGVRSQLNVKEGQKLVALLPGSRKQEITTMLSLMKKLPKAYPEYRFAIGKAPSQEETFYRSVLTNVDIPLYTGTYSLLAAADAALVTSGTATLETALIGTPQVVCYKGSTISYWIARMLVKIKYISLVNLVYDGELVKELIQGDFNEKNLKKNLNDILKTDSRDRILQGYAELRKKLGGKGASDNAAEIIHSML